MDHMNKYQHAIGEAYVLTGDDTERWSRDWPGQYKWAPTAVLRPANTEQVAAILCIAQEHGDEIVPASGMTGLAGGAKADGALMLSLDRMNQIIEVRADARIAIVEAGCILSNIHEAADAHDLVFPLTFGAKGSAMIGGCLATNAGGSNVLRYGNTRDLCLGIEAVLPGGKVLNLMSELHKDNSGYNLKHLLIGSEGTLGVITRAVLKLHPKPRAYATAMVAVPSLDDALSLLNIVQLETGGAVEAFEFMPKVYMQQLIEIKPDVRPPFDSEYDVNILIEVGSTVPAECTPQEDGSIPLVERLEDILGRQFEDGAVLDAVIAKNHAERREMWERREAAAEVQLAKPHLVNNDIAVPLDRVAEFYDLAHQRVLEVLPNAPILAIAHLGDGNLHFVVELGAQNAQRKDEIMELIEELVLEFGGSFSAEHGVGLSKLPSMERRKDKEAVAAMKAIKAALDPKGILNPGKLLP